MEGSGFKFAVPKRKKHTSMLRECLFPVPIESLTRIPTSVHFWYHYAGHLVGQAVYVNNPADMEALYNMVRN